MSTIAAPHHICQEAHPAPALEIHSRPYLSALALLMADLVALSLPAFVSNVILPEGWWPFEAIVATVAIVTVFLLCGLYPGVDLHSVSEIRKVFAGTAIVAIAGLGLSFRSYHNFRNVTIVLLWALGMLLTLITRASMRSLCRHRRWWGQPVFILGKASSAKRVIDRLRKHPEFGLKPVALFYEDGGSADPSEGVPVLQGFGLVDQLARRYRVRCAVVTHPDAFADSMLEMVEVMAPSLQRILFASDLPCPSSLETRAVDLSRILTLDVRRTLLLRSARLQKRVFDLAVAVPLLVLAAPLSALIALIVKLESKGPVFYGHIRVGRNGKDFKIWKLRSMVTNADKVLSHYLAGNPEAAEEWKLTHKLRSDPRITKLGAILRRTSLDELPQLWNVLCGEMSLVGPRPVVESEACRYGSFFKHYKQVAPGLTGLWQVSGRSDTTYEERVDLDTFYVRNWSVWLDLHILAKTFNAVINKDGAY